MRAMILDREGAPLRAADVPNPIPHEGEVLLRVHVCGVCRTDLHVAEGEWPHPKPHLIPGHETIGTVVGAGPGAERFRMGERVGVPWLGAICGRCRFCLSGRENLCLAPQFTGYDLNAAMPSTPWRGSGFCFAVPDGFTDAEAALLLCVGLPVGRYGSGAAAHLVAQVARYEGRSVYAFTRPGEVAGQLFARSLGAVWDRRLRPDAAGAARCRTDIGPLGELVPAALRAADRGGTVVCSGIHMSDIPSVG